MSNMFDNFATRSRRVVVLAHDTARDKLRCSQVDPSHLLLAVRWEGGAASKILDTFGVTEPMILAVAGIGDLAPAGYIPFTDGSRKVFKLAVW